MASRISIRNVINPQCCRNFAQSCAMYIPIDWLGRYVLLHIDTVPKLLDHVLILMAVCNFFCMISARKIASLSAFATFLLGFQNAVLLWVLKGNRNNQQRQQQRQVSLFLPPTEFMIGVCLGITIGGTILSFFLCLMYGKSHEFCEEVIHMTNTANNNNNNNNNTTDDDSSGSRSSTYVDMCRTWKGAIDGVWWWSSCVFWLNLLTCILIAAGRHDIANNNNSGMNNAQYETIMDNNNNDDDNNNNNNMTGGMMNPNNNEDQYQQQYKQSQQQQQQSQSQQGSYSGTYNNVPDINHPGQPVPQQQQQQQQQFVDLQQQQHQQQSMMSHQNSVQRHHQQEDPLLV